MGSFLPVRAAARRAGVLLPALALGLLMLLSAACLPGDGNPIVFVSDSDGDPEIYLLDPENGETTRLTNNEAPDLTPRWSPDGEYIAYTSHESGNEEVNLLDKKGAQFRRLTNNPGADGSPRWAPENDRLAFFSERAEGGETVAEIYSMNTQGGELSRVSFNATPERLGGWSPNGEWVVFHAEDSWEERGLWLRNPLGVNLIRLTEGQDSQPVWSPNGRYIAFVRQQGDAADIYVVRKSTDGDWGDGVEEERLTQSDSDDVSPAWHPDSKILAFVSSRDGNPEIYTIQADGANPQRLTRNAAADQAPVWSPNGKQIAFVTYLFGTAEILVMEADGSNQRRLTNNTFEDDSPDW